MNSLAKKALLLGGATLLAVGVNAQVRDRATMARYQAYIQQIGVGGGTGGSGGVINGPRPTPLSPVVVTTPVATPVPVRRP